MTSLCVNYCYAIHYSLTQLKIYILNKALYVYYRFRSEIIIRYTK